MSALIGSEGENHLHDKQFSDCHVILFNVFVAVPPAAIEQSDLAIALIDRMKKLFAGGKGLVTFETVTDSIITSTHRPGISYKSIIIHEFLHLCGDIESPTRPIVDGVIRHTKIGTEAIEPLIG